MMFQINQLDLTQILMKFQFFIKMKKLKMKNLYEKKI